MLIGSLPVFSQVARNRYTLILEDPPVAERYPGRDAVRSGDAVAYQTQVESKQRDLRNELSNRHIQVTGSVSVLLNAIFVIATPDRVQELKGLPGVKAVVPQRVQKVSLNRAPALLDVPAAWTAVGGMQNAGAGIKIGILDTGIDQTHPMFQDASLAIPAGFPKCNAQSDCTNFTNNKVIVARSYVKALAAGSNPANPAVDSRPDDYSARDLDGHGSAVASAAAGNTATGTVTINGIAPKAYLGNYKIYGSDEINTFSSEDVVIQALEDAQSDGMDIVSYSSGGPAIAQPSDTGAVCDNPVGVPCDTEAQAFENAARAGLIVVIVAGNDGTVSSIESPGDAADAITVGATTNAHQFFDTVSVPGAPSNLQAIATAQSPDANALYPGAITLPLVDVTMLGDNGLACSSIPNYIPYGLYNGIALIERGTCDFSTKVTNAMNAGAAAVILYMADSSTPVAPSGLSNLIPTVMVSNADGLNLKAYADANPYAPATMDPDGSEMSDTADQNELASYSSRGPNLGNSIKPDLVAVGGDTDFATFFNLVYTAAQSYDPRGGVYSSTGYSGATGTSLAAPMVAGAAAMIKQKHPAYTAAQIKSALVNAATQDVLTDDLSPPDNVDVQWYGGGKLDANGALNATVSASPVSLSFGVIASLPQTLALQLTNHGASAVALALSYVPNPNYTSTASLTFDHTSLSLAPGASGTVNVTLTGTVPTPQEYSAFVAIKGAGVSLTVPVMYLVPNGLNCQNQAGCNLISLGGNFDGIVGTVPYPGTLAVKLTDDYGVPIAGAPVTFSAMGGGSVQNADAKTNVYGIAQADALLGPSQGDTTYTASAAGQVANFEGYARVQPTIPANGVMNAASLNPTQPIAPGSYIAISGTGLSDPGYTDASTSERLALGLDEVFVSFDVPSAGISVPGHLSYVSPTQVNAQVPWELQGQSSVQMKVTINYSPGNVVTVPVSNYSPAFFENPAGCAYSASSTGCNAIAQDSNYKLVTSSNPVARGGVAVLYVNGLGPVTNQPAGGDPSPSSPLAQTTTTPVVTIGGQPAPVAFSGLVPTIAGLYQINVTVPSNINAGSQPLTVAIGGQTSPTSGIVVK